MKFNGRKWCNVRFKATNDMIKFAECLWLHERWSFNEITIDNPSETHSKTIFIMIVWINSNCIIFSNVCERRQFHLPTRSNVNINLVDNELYRHSFIHAYTHIQRQTFNNNGAPDLKPNMTEIVNAAHCWNEICDQKCSKYLETTVAWESNYQF